MKAMLKSRAAMAIWGSVAAAYIWLVYRSGRWTSTGGELQRQLFTAGTPFIMAVWHGRIGMMVHAPHNAKNVRVLISNHRDGELISRAIGHFGIPSIRGSARSSQKKAKNKGGMNALRAMIRAIGEGHTVFITPDGPRGPRMRASIGTIKLAQITGAPILPVSFSASNARVLTSWDRMIVPRPFRRGVFVWGAPIHVPRRCDDGALEEHRLTLERELNRVTREADEHVGQAVIEPAPAPHSARAAPS